MLAQTEGLANDFDRPPDGSLPPAVTAAPRAEADAEVDARSAARRPASEIQSITGVRLSPLGVNARLLNISASGVLVESANRIRLATSVTVIFDGTFTPASVEGRVARSSVASISKSGVLQYHIGIAFNDPTALAKAFAPPDPVRESSLEPGLAMPTSAGAALVNRW